MRLEAERLLYHHVVIKNLQAWSLFTDRERLSLAHLALVEVVHFDAVDITATTVRGPIFQAGLTAFEIAVGEMRQQNPGWQLPIVICRDWGVARQLVRYVRR